MPVVKENWVLTLQASTCEVKETAIRSLFFHNVYYGKVGKKVPSLLENL